MGEENNIHSHADELGQMKSRHQVDEGIFGHQLADVEDGRAPGVLVARHLEIGDETEDGGVGEGLLVEILEEEDEAHLTWVLVIRTKP